MNLSEISLKRIIICLTIPATTFGGCHPLLTLYATTDLVPVSILWVFEMAPVGHAVRPIVAKKYLFSFIFERPLSSRIRPRASLGTALRPTTPWHHPRSLLYGRTPPFLLACILNTFKLIVGTFQANERSLWHRNDKTTKRPPPNGKGLTWSCFSRLLDWPTFPNIHSIPRPGGMRAGALNRLHPLGGRSVLNEHTLSWQAPKPQPAPHTLLDHSPQIQFGRPWDIKFPISFDAWTLVLTIVWISTPSFFYKL